MENRDLEKQILFLKEIDRMKSVLRQNHVIEEGRREDDAGHSWHAAVMAMTLASYAKPQVQVDRAIRMLLIHDLVEIYAGDTPCFDSDVVATQAAREQAAADKVAALLPEEQGKAYRALWEEFDRVETDDAELKRRVEEFIRLGQYDNAMIAADRIRDDVVRRESLEEVRVYSLFVNKGDYRGAGIAFWEKGMYAKAREMFSLSGDRGLIEFMDACIGKGNSALDYGIVSYFNEVTDPSAGRLITETLNEDLEQMKKTQREVKQKLSSIRRKHG